MNLEREQGKLFQSEWQSRLLSFWRGLNEVKKGSRSLELDVIAKKMMMSQISRDALYKICYFMASNDPVFLDRLEITGKNFKDFSATKIMVRGEKGELTMLEQEGITSFILPAVSRYEKSVMLVYPYGGFNQYQFIENLAGVKKHFWGLEKIGTNKGIVDRAAWDNKATTLTVFGKEKSIDGIELIPYLRVFRKIGPYWGVKDLIK